MPERQFSLPHAISFLKLVLIPAGVWGPCWRRKELEYRRNPKAGHREAWMKTMGEASFRHGPPWGVVVMDELRRTGFACLREPNKELFAKLKRGMPWKSMSAKDRLASGLLAARELGLDVSAWTDTSNHDSVQLLRSRNWSLTKVGKELVKKVYKVRQRRKIVPEKPMSPREVIDWVANNIDNPNRDSAKIPCAAARAMLNWAVENAEKFWMKYMEKGFTVEKAVTPPDQKPAEGAERSLDDLLNSALAEKA